MIILVKVKIRIFELQLGRINFEVKHNNFE